MDKPKRTHTQPALRRPVNFKASVGKLLFDPVISWYLVSLYFFSGYVIWLSHNQRNSQVLIYVRMCSLGLDIQQLMFQGRS